MSSSTIAQSERDDWCTPPEILDAARAVIGGELDFDPCSNAGSLVRARREAVCLPDDGLAIDWSPFKSIWVNPPYQPIAALRAWVEAAAYYGADRRRHVFLLVPAATETRHFQHEILETADRILFFRGRLTFIDPLTGKPAPGPQRKGSALAYWGPRAYSFEPFFRSFGIVVQPGRVP